MCPLYRDIRFIEIFSKIVWPQSKAIRSSSYCPSYRGVRFIVCPLYRDSTVFHWKLYSSKIWWLIVGKTSFNTAQKMKFSIKDFFSKCDQIHSFLRIWSHLLKKSLLENFIFLCSVIFDILLGILWVNSNQKWIYCVIFPAL